VAKFREDNGNIYLDGDDFDLKIDVNRMVYIKNKDETYFSSIEVEIPTGYKRPEKERYLAILYEKIRDKRLEQSRMEA
jgi:hypothetical protein